MARSEFVADSASCQFFWLLFDSDLTPAGVQMGSRWVGGWVVGG
ncbi:unnamed protein product, partial [Laminaria digitata]